jgi:HAE1 family hydrophobic/amphiphilic exporter-1
VKLSKLAINRPVTVLMGTLLVLLLGVVSFTRLPVDLFPELSLPVAVIWTEYPGAGPEEVENMVTRPVEEAVSTLGNLKQLSSQSTAGSSVVIANFNWSTDMDFAALDMRESIDLIRGYLPDEAGRPLIIRLDPALMPILHLGVSGDLDQAGLTALAQDVLKNRLERIEGVAVVQVEGGLVSEVEVAVDLQRLGQAGVSLQQLQQALTMENLNFSGGQFHAGGREYQVRTVGQYRSLEEMGDIVVGQDAGGSVYLRDVATLCLQYKEEQVITRMNGEPVVSLSIRKQSDANTLGVATAVRHEIKKMTKELPGQLNFSVAIDQSSYISRAVSNVISTVLVGAALAVLVLYLFMGSLTATLIISAAIPISVIAAFSFMYFYGMTLNIVTLGGMALGVGMMVDNAIVILENIYRYRNLGEKPASAALLGSGEMAGAITAATLTTVVVFIPVLFVEGLAGIVFRPLAWTVGFALLASLFMALTVVPLLCSRSQLLQPAEQPEGQRFTAVPLRVMQNLMQKLNSFYAHFLAWALGRRWLVVGSVLGLLTLSLALVPLIGSEFLPEEDSGTLFVNLQLPVGSCLEETDLVAREIEALLQTGHPEIETVFSYTGTGGTLFETPTPEDAQIWVMLVPREKRKLSTREVAEKLRGELALVPGVDIAISTQDITMGMTSEGGAVNIAVKGDDLELLQGLTTEVARIVEGVEGTKEVDTSLSGGRPEVQVRLDRERAAAWGVSTAQVASLVRTALEGQVVTRYRVGGKEYDVRLKGGEDFVVESPAALKTLPLLTPAGPVHLGQVAAVTTGTGPRSISRDGQVRTAYVTADVFGRDLGSVMQDVQKKLGALELPAGYTIDFAGEVINIEESFSSLGFALLLAIPLIYMIMAAQFESLLFPLIIMFSLPQAFTGVVLSLVLTGKALSVPALIGVILLSGIVVNNGIVLVDYINILRREKGYSREEAIRLAGPVRLRPILMTTLTTVLGMLPLSLGLKEGSEMQSPMAIVIIGGLTFSTLVTLIFVPVMYSLLDDLALWFRAKFQGGTFRGRERGMPGGR